MKSRYFVVVPVETEIATEIKLFYRNTFQNEMTAVNLHMSLLPPFFIKEGVTETEVISKIKTFSFSAFETNLNKVDAFNQKGRSYLHLKVVPEDKCKDLSVQLMSSLVDLIEIDKSPYTNGVVPDFEAHITIDYDFKGGITDSPLDITFPVNKISCFKGEGGEWIECVLEGGFKI